LFGILVSDKLQFVAASAQGATLINSFAAYLSLAKLDDELEDAGIGFNCLPSSQSDAAYLVGSSFPALKDRAKFIRTLRASNLD